MLMHQKTKPCRRFYRYLQRYHGQENSELGVVARTLANCRKTNCFKEEGYVNILHHLRRRHPYSQEQLTALWEAYNKFMELQRFLAKRAPVAIVLLCLCLPAWSQTLPSVAPSAVVTAHKKIGFKLQHPYLYKLSLPVTYPCSILYKAGKKAGKAIGECL
jgi:hypothetical protein